MEKGRRTALHQSIRNSFNKPIFVSAALGILVLSLHHSALTGGWRYEDGFHLLFTVRYSPWQYFFIPDIMREQSWAHFTPWNAFFYELGLPVFGLNAAGHYAHLLLVIWATALSTFFLLRLWLPAFQSFMAAVLFLCAPATGAVGQVLMTGHYAYGLFFVTLSVYFFARGIRKKSYGLSVIAAGFYLLACWCKELYVPAIGILILLPEATLKTRLRYAIPSIFSALIYTGYRLVVLEGIGGYGLQLQNMTYDASQLAQTFLANLFGELWLGYIVLAFLLLSTTIGLFTRKLSINWIFVTGTLVVIFFPVTSMILSGNTGLALHNRLLFFVSWAIAVALCWLTQNNKLQAVCLIVIAGFLIYSQQQTIASISGASVVAEKEYQFLMESSEEDILLPANYSETIYLKDFGQVVRRIEKQTPPVVIDSEEDVANLGNRLGAKAHQYNLQCQCVQQLGEEVYQQRVNEFRSSLLNGANQPLSVHMDMKNFGLRGLVKWGFSGPQGRYFMYIPGYTVFQLPPVGEMNYGTTSFFRKKQNASIYFHLVTPDGAIIRSPMMKFHPYTDNEISWSGPSAVTWQ